MRTLTELSRLMERLARGPAVRRYGSSALSWPRLSARLSEPFRDQADHGCLPLLRLGIPVQRVVMHREAVLGAVDFDEPGFALVIWPTAAREDSTGTKVSPVP